jgi:hypothetical protein
VQKTSIRAVVLVGAMLILLAYVLITKPFQPVELPTNDEKDNSTIPTNSTENIEHNDEPTSNSTDIETPIIDNKNNETDVQPVLETPLLHVNGTDIVDENNNVVKLRAINVASGSRENLNGTSGRSWEPDVSWFTEMDVIELKKMGVNMIEIHNINVEYFIDGMGRIREFYFEKWVDIWTEWGKRNEMYILLDISGFSVPNPNNPWGVYSMPVWMSRDYDGKPTTYQEQADINFDFFNLEVEHMDDERDLFLKQWVFTVNRYKNNSYVMYSIVNEPLIHTHNNWPNSELKEQVALGYSQYMTKIIDEIRKNGSEQIIFINRPYFKSNPWSKYLMPIERENIVWEAHDYVGFTSLGDWMERVIDYQRFFEESFEKPFYLGEWHIDPVSVKDKYDLRQVTQTQIEFIERRGIDHAFFSWDRLFGYQRWVNRETSNSFTDEEVEMIMEVVFHE